MRYRGRPLHPRRRHPAVPPGARRRSTASAIVDSDEILDLKRLPRSLTVVGAGVIGVEYATIFSALDVRVTMIEPRATMLEFVDRELIDEFIHDLRDRGIALRLGCKVNGDRAAPATAARVRLDGRPRGARRDGAVRRRPRWARPTT